MTIGKKLGQSLIIGLLLLLYIIAAIAKERGIYMLEKTLKELEREALLIAFGKGDIEKYWYLKGKSDAELELYIENYKKI